jgi:hypothetical protein
MTAKRTLLRIESHRSVTVTMECATVPSICAACGRETRLLSTSEVALFSGRSESEVKDAISQGLLHTQLMQEGSLAICAHSMMELRDELKF